VFSPQKLAKLQSKAPSARTGGKGSVRRKHKAVRKAAVADDKRLKSTLNRLNVRDIPAIEEVNLFREDGSVIHFVNPKVQASIAANTYVVAGTSENKKLQDLLPGIITQLGPDSLDYLKKMYASGPAGMAGLMAGAKGAVAGADGDDDDVPALVDNFEDVSKKAAPAAAAKKTEANDAKKGAVVEEEEEEDGEEEDGDEPANANDVD